MLREESPMTFNASSPFRYNLNVAGSKGEHDNKKQPTQPTMTASWFMWREGPSNCAIAYSLQWAPILLWTKLTCFTTFLHNTQGPLCSYLRNSSIHILFEHKNMVLANAWCSHLFKSLHLRPRTTNQNSCVNSVSAQLSSDRKQKKPVIT